MGSLAFWMGLWKAVFIISVAAFSVMSLWVTVGGALDIKALLRILREEHAAKNAKKQD